MDPKEKHKMSSKNDKHSKIEHNNKDSTIVSDVESSEKGFIIYLLIKKFVFVKELTEKKSADYAALNHYIQNDLMRILLEAHEWETAFSVESISFSECKSSCYPVMKIHLKSNTFTNQKDLQNTIKKLVKTSNGIFKFVNDDGMIEDDPESEKEEDAEIQCTDVEDRSNAKFVDIAFVFFLVFTTLLLLWSSNEQSVNKEQEYIACHETARVNYVKMKITNDEYNYVIVSGPPISGKSAAIDCAARYLQQRFGYFVYNVEYAKEILNYYDAAKPQLFVFDDPVGKVTLNVDKLNDWTIYNNPIREALKLSNKTKVLITVRNSILNNDRVASSQYIFNQKSHLVDFSQPEHQLSTNDMRDMLRKHLEIRKVINIDAVMNDIIFSDTDLEDYALLSDFFPLKCEYYAEKISKRTDSDEFFITPYRVFSDTFRDMLNENKYQFCGLVLISVFGGEVKDTLFDSFGAYFQTQKVTEVLDSFNLTSSDLKSVQTALQVVNGTYLLNINGKYRLLHALYKDIVLYLYNNTSCYLKFASLKFILHTVRIDYVTEKDKSVFVILKRREDIENLSKRLVHDLKENFNVTAKAIVNYPHIDNKKLLIHMQESLFHETYRGANRTFIDSLFVACMTTLFNRYYSCYDTLDSNGEILTLGHKFVDILLKIGANSNIVINKLGLYPIHVSAIIGNKALAKLLIDHGAYVDSKNTRNESVLHLVVQNHHNRINEQKACLSRLAEPFFDAEILISESTNLVKFFITKGSAVNVNDISGATVLHQIIRGNHREADSLVKLLLEHDANIYATDNVGASPLHHTAMVPTRISLKIAELLVSHSKTVTTFKGGFGNEDKIYVNIVDTKGRTPLHYLALYPSKQRQDSKSFTHPDEDPAFEEHKYLLLHSSVPNGNINYKLQMTKLLIDNGADVNALDSNGFSILHYISIYHNDDAIKLASLLIERNANISVRDTDGRCVLHHIAMLPTDISLQIAKIIVSYSNNLHSVERGFRNVDNIYVNIADLKGRTPLHYLILYKSNQIQVSKSYTHLGKRVDVEDEHRYSLLRPSITLGNKLQLAKLLLDNGANVNAFDKNGLSILHYVSSFNDNDAIELASLFIERNINIDVRDTDGRGVLHHIAMLPTNVSLKIANLLVSYSNNLHSVERGLGNVDNKYVNMVDCSGRTPLHYLAIYKSYQAQDSKTFTQFGKNPAHEDEHEKLLLCASLTYENKLQLATLLLDNGANVNALDNNGFSILHYISTYHNDDAIKLASLLIYRNANISVRDTDGRGVLHHIAMLPTNVSLQIANLLVSHSNNLHSVEGLGNVDIKYVNFVDFKGRTPLHYLAIYKTNQIKDSKSFTQFGKNPALEDEHENSLLRSSLTYANKLQLAKLLIDNGANVNAFDKNGLTILHYISSFHDDEAIQLASLLIERNANINAKDNNGRGVLHHIVMNNETSHYSIQLAKLFLSSYVDVNATDNDNLTALHYISVFRSKYSLELANLFLKHNINMNAIDSDGRNALQYIFYNCKYSKGCSENLDLKNSSNVKDSLCIPEKGLELVSLLAKCGININWQDFEGKTALHYAVAYVNNALDFAQILIKNNANVRIADIYGYTVLHYLSLYDTDQTLYLAIIFLEQTIDIINFVDINGRTVLHTAILNEHYSRLALARFLINHGADVDIFDNSGRTALHYSIANTTKHGLEFVRLLLHSYANVHATDNDGRTALHYAAISGKQHIGEMAMLLIEGGININAEDNEGRTAFYYTTISVNIYKSNLSKLLKENGANTNTDDDNKGISTFHWTINYVSNQLSSIETYITAALPMFAMVYYGNLPGMDQRKNLFC